MRTYMYYYYQKSFALVVQIYSCACHVLPVKCKTVSLLYFNLHLLVFLFMLWCSVNHCAAGRRRLASTPVAAHSSAARSRCSHLTSPYCATHDVCAATWFGHFASAIFTRSCRMGCTCDCAQVLNAETACSHAPSARPCVAMHFCACAPCDRQYFHRASTSHACAMLSFIRVPIARSPFSARRHYPSVGKLQL